MAARGTSQKKKQLKNTARAIGSRVWAVEEDSITITTLYIVDCPTIFRASIHAAMIPCMKEWPAGASTDIVQSKETCHAAPAATTAKAANGYAEYG